MSYTATGYEGRDAAEARRQNALTLTFLMLIVPAFCIRFFIPPMVMNFLMEYTTEEGSFYEKLHAGTYAILLLLPVVLFSRPFILQGDDIYRFKVLLRYCAFILLLVVFLILTGRTSAGGLFVDTYLIAGAAGLIMLAMNRDARRIIGDCILAMIMVSVALAMVEFATRTRIMPYAEGELVFRPTGLADHPLTLGLIAAASISFVAMTRWRIWMKLGAIVFLVVGVAASGARFALVLTVVEVFALVLFIPWTSLSRNAERKAKLATLLMVLAGGALLFAVLGASGAFDRFQNGIVDANFFARTDIYQIFGLVELRDILFGAPIPEILKIVNTKIGLPYIESSPVYFTFLLGAPLAACVFLLLFWLYGRLLRHVALPAWIGALVFIVGALSNNTLSTKTPVITIFIVLILAYAHHRPASREG